eukprot:542782-Prymnesium_polylepis.1
MTDRQTALARWLAASRRALAAVGPCGARTASHARSSEPGRGRGGRVAPRPRTTAEQNRRALYREPSVH